MPKLPLSPTSVWSVVKEMRVGDEDLRPLLVGGAPEQARAIHAALAEGAEPDAVRDLSGKTPIRVRPRGRGRAHLGRRRRGCG